ncbi:hypothetical protein EKO23_23165 [Nocardioides guangzhouensis]|uniref:DUF3558 domain-containing protein n=1 Tax=Nocardioides guangzhouensis TaxID=2497878 RepID=A0A4Q4Z256_9ACTN|nr:hypothetical protein [Nocardioides guangzhouensis]RYP81700.1 hypothetical protein EKO23_23165 [Nocardioides guangzhouensis]
MSLPRHLPLPTRALPWARALAAAALLLAGTACTGDDGGDDGASPPHAEPTPITDFDATGSSLARDEFCDGIPEASVTAAVGEVASTDHYGNGDRDRITDGVTDVAHEFSCTFTGDSGAVARAWVFVPRVTRAQAKEYVAAAGDAKGCRAVDGHGFGTPGTGLVCRTGDGIEASYRGLFTDTWFACSLTAKDLDEPTLLDQAGQWCVATAGAATVEPSG